MAEQMKGHKHLDYKKLYLNSKRRGKRLLTANHVTIKIQNDPLVLLRMA